MEMEHLLLQLILNGNGNGETAAAASDVSGDGIIDLFLGAIYSDEVILWLVMEWKFYF